MENNAATASRLSRPRRVCSFAEVRAMSDFLFSFALFWAGTLLLLGYAVILYAAGAALHYIAEHDEMEAMFTTYDPVAELEI